MIEDYRPVVNELSSVGQELTDVYTLDDGRLVVSDVTAVTSNYDQVKRAVRDKLHQLNDALQPTLTDVSFSLITIHCPFLSPSTCPSIPSLFLPYPFLPREHSVARLCYGKLSVAPIRPSVRPSVTLVDCGHHHRHHHHYHTTG